MRGRRPIPIYQNHGGIYEADTCAPLVQAATAGKVHLDALVHGHYPGRSLLPRELPGLKSVGYWDAPEDQDWGLPWHRNEGIELTFLQRGRLGFAVDGQEFELQPNDLTVTRPWQSHRVGLPRVYASRLAWLILDVGVRRPNQDWRWPKWIVLSAKDREELTDILRHNEQPVWPAPPDARGYWEKITQIVGHGPSATLTSRLALCINGLLLSVLELLRGHHPRLDRSLTTSLRTVELFLRDLQAHAEHLERRWTVKQMAAQCGLGVTQFTHYVRQLTGMTPLRFLKQARLELAARLLRQRPNHSVLEIALACGFASSQYFATSFARRYGCAPTAWRGARPSKISIRPSDVEMGRVSC